MLSYSHLSYSVPQIRPNHRISLGTNIRRTRMSKIRKWEIFLTVLLVAIVAGIIVMKTYHPYIVQSVDGKIVFVSNSGADQDIFLMVGNSNNVIDLTNSGHATSPALSPDGTQIAFCSGLAGNWNIYVMNLDGSKQTDLTNNSSDDVEPWWSPDGSRIVFSSNRDGNYYNIYTMYTDGSNVTRLTNTSANDISPYWSPDGASIIFTSNRNGNNNIYIMHTDGSNQTRMNIMETGGSNQTVITNSSADDRDASISPDGTKLVFCSNMSGNYEIYVWSAGNPTVPDITNNRANDINPSWSPDGKKIIFVSNRNGDYEIYIMDADGKHQTRMTYNPNDDYMPRWSK